MNLTPILESSTKEIEEVMRILNNELDSRRIVVDPPPKADKSISPLDRQEAGDHYKTMKIQPVEFCQANGLGFCESSVIKYVCRHKRKNGAEDIRKAIHFLELLLELELEYGKNLPTLKEMQAACQGKTLINPKP